MAIDEASILNNLNIGTSKASIENKPQSPMAQLLTSKVNEIVKRLSERMDYYDISASNRLKQSTQPTGLKATESGYEISIESDFYWKLVNYGVNGTLINRGAPNWGIQPQNGMTFEGAIDGWIKDRGITAPEGMKYETLNFLIRRKIVQDGKEARPFFTDVVNEALSRELGESVSKLMKRSITIIIKDPWQ